MGTSLGKRCTQPGVKRDEHESEGSLRVVWNRSGRARGVLIVLMARRSGTPRAGDRECRSEDCSEVRVTHHLELKERGNHPTANSAGKQGPIRGDAEIVASACARPRPVDWLPDPGRCEKRGSSALGRPAVPQERPTLIVATSEIAEEENLSRPTTILPCFARTSL